MRKFSRKSFLEKKVKTFFDCGWRIRKLKKEKDYLIISPGGNVYSSEDVNGDCVYSFYDYSTMGERDSASKLFYFLKENLTLIKTYRKYVEFV